MHTRFESFSTRTSSANFREAPKEGDFSLQVIHELDSERNSIKSDPDSQVEEDAVSLHGRYVLGVRDFAHLERLQRVHGPLLDSLVRDHVPIVYLEDLQSRADAGTLTLILDYFSFDRSQELKSSDVLSFSNLFLKRISNGKQQISLSNRSSDSPLRQSRWRSKSVGSSKKPYQPDRFLQIHNIDHQHVEADGEEAIISLTFLKENSYGEDRLSQVTFKPCCYEGKPSCQHISRFDKISVEALVYYAFTSENTYYLAVAILTYELFLKSHVDFVKEAFTIYFKCRRNVNLQIQIVRYLFHWLDFRLVDLVEDSSNLCTLLSYFINFAILLNFKRSSQLDELLRALLQSAHDLKDQKLGRVSKKLSAKVTKTRRSSDQLSKRRHRVQNSVNIFPLSQEGQRKPCLPFTDWQFYLDVPVSVLQKQLWIIEVQLFSQVSLSDLQRSNEKNPLVSEDSQIPDHFDFLLFHLVCSTIYCPPEHLQALFGKLIELYTLSAEAQHFQLVYVMFCYFSHRIVQGILNFHLHLNRRQQQLLQELQEAEVYRTLNPVELGAQNGIIPCLSQIQLCLYRIRVNLIQADWRTLNFTLLEHIAHLLFSVGQLQVLERKCCTRYLGHLQEPYYSYLKIEMKQSLLNHFQCEKTQMEIQMFRLWRALTSVREVH